MFSRKKKIKKKSKVLTEDEEIVKKANDQVVFNFNKVFFCNQLLVCSHRIIPLDIWLLSTLFLEMGWMLH